MVISKRHLIIVIIIILVTGVSLFIVSDISLSSLLPHPEPVNTPTAVIQTPTGMVTLLIPIPETPTNLTLYHVIPQPNDMAYYSVTNLETVRSNVTSEADAPAVALKSLEKYGGLPDGAKLAYVKTEYLEGINGLTGQVTERDPISTNVQYTRSIDGIPITGNGGFINIELGDNGELLYLNKVWRTVEPVGTIKVIPVSKAITKLGNGDELNHLKCFCDLTVDRIYIAYYEKDRNVPQEDLDPVWVFSGTSSAEVINYKVYARQFANFTASPSSGIAPLVVQFNDTSETKPVKWLWNFGDGINSTEHNPVYIYQTSGTYNVTLTAWNDLGSDTVTKPVQVIS
jgi:hypothetical protein